MFLILSPTVPELGVVCNVMINIDIVYIGSAGGLSDYVAMREKHAIPLSSGLPLDVGGEAFF